jgi:hypothetical protein
MEHSCSYRVGSRLYSRAGAAALYKPHPSRLVRGRPPRIDRNPRQWVGTILTSVASWAWAGL